MRNRSMCLVLLSAALLMVNAPAAFAQEASKDCDISGTWYGGSDPGYPYLFTVMPRGGGRYSSIAANAYPMSQYPGYNSMTNWSIEFLKVNARDYDSHGMGFFVYQWLTTLCRNFLK